MTAPRDCHDCRSAAPCDEHASGAPRPADPPAPKAEEADEATKRDARAVIEAVAAQMSVSEVDALQTFMGAYAMGKADGTRAAEAERDALRARVAELEGALRDVQPIVDASVVWLNMPAETPGDMMAIDALADAVQDYESRVAIRAALPAETKGGESGPDRLGP